MLCRQGSLLAVLAAAGLAASASAECEIDRLAGVETVAFDSFGTAVAVDGDVMVVGSPSADMGAGAVYVFRREGAFWSQEARLTAPMGGGSLDALGSAVAVRGDVVVAGAPGATGAAAGSGLAFVYEFDGAAWVWRQTLSAAGGQGQDFFGHSVGVSAERIIVGAYGDDDGGSSSGSAHVYLRNGAAWLFEQALTAGDAEAEAQFGWSVAIEGVTAVVGANLDDHLLADEGAAYVFTFNGAAWSEAAKLRASDAAASNAFGQSVAVSGDGVLVGAVAGEGMEANSGSAYVFRDVGGTWTEEEVLTSADGQSGDSFGWSVAFDGDMALVGARGEDEMANRAGAAYAFVQSGGLWSQTAKLMASDAGPDDFFGVSVGLSEGRAAVGSIFNDTTADNAGAAYIFVLAGDDCNGNLSPDECDIAAGVEVDLDLDGVPDSCQAPSCPCETDGAAGVNVFDLLGYLDLWFAGAAGADIDGVAGVNVFDLLFFLDCWFPASAGSPCP